MTSNCTTNYPNITAGATVVIVGDIYDTAYIISTNLVITQDEPEPVRKECYSKLDCFHNKMVSPQIRYKKVNRNYRARPRGG